MSHEYQPPTASTVVAVAAALLVTVSVAAVSRTLALLSGTAIVVLAGALYRGSFRLVQVATVLSFVVLLAAGILGESTAVVLFGAVGVLVLYDAGQYAVRLGKQIGAAGETAGAELSHVGTTVGLSGVFAGAGAVVFTFSPSGQPAFVAPTLLVAGALFLLALSRSETADQTATE